MSDPIAQHIMLRLVDDRIIASTPAARCTLARSVLTIGRDYGLLAFRGSDNHVHAEAPCSKKEAYEYARRTETSLRRLLELPVPFERARVKPVVDQRHCFRQEQRHRIASNLPDLLGMRLLADYTRDNVRRLLPRIGNRELLRYFGDIDLPAAQVDIADLAAAASAAYAVLDLRGNTKPTAQARRAAVHTASALQLAAPDERFDAAAIGELLTIGPRAVRKLRQQPVNEQGVRAVTLQLRLRAAVRTMREGTRRHAPAYSGARIVVPR